MSLEETIRALAREEARKVLAEQRPESELLTPAQAGRLVGRKARTIRAYVHAGDLKRYGKGERILVDRAELLDLMKRPRPRSSAPTREASALSEAARLMEGG